MGTCGADRLSDGFAFVRSEIVHHDDIAGSECGHEHRHDIGQECLAVDRPINHKGRRDAIVTQRCNERHCTPTAVRHLRDERLAAPAPAAQWRHVGLRPGLVDKDEAGRINALLILLPTHAAARDVRTILLGGEHGFF